MDRPLYYVLDGNGVEVEATIEEWSEFLASSGRRVAETAVGGAWISTVFLGIDHRFVGCGPPLLYETMVFGCDSEIMERHSTRSEAMLGHKRLVETVRKMLKERA